MTQPSLRRLEGELRPFVGSRVPPSDVDDVLQEVFVRLHRHRHQVRDETALRPWIYRVTRRAIADRHRARARSPLLLEAPPEPGADAASTPHDEPNVLAEQLASLMPTLVAQLPSPYREALTLTELQGHTQAEAARMLGVSLPALKSRVARGRQRLRDRLEACCAIALDARNRVTACEPRPGQTVIPACCLAPAGQRPERGATPPGCD